MCIETYESESKFDSTEKLVEHWLADKHDDTWGDIKYDTFNTPDNKSQKSSFFEPFSTKQNQPDPPEGKTDFEHLSDSEYVSPIPIHVAERIGEEVQSNLTRQQKEVFVERSNNYETVNDIYPEIYTIFSYTKGLPDIVAWEEDDPKEGSYKFIEVKKVEREGGYQDGIRVDQAVWFSFFDHFDSYTIYVEKIDT